MQEVFEATLTINNAPVNTNPFVEQFLARTAVAGASTLRGVREIKNLKFSMEQDNVSVVVNGEDIKLTPFPKDIIVSTMTGLVSPLRGVDAVNSMTVNVSKQS